MVYLPAGAPDRDAVAVKALEWQRGSFVVDVQGREAADRTRGWRIFSASGRR